MQPNIYFHIFLVYISKDPDQTVCVFPVCYSDNQFVNFSALMTYIFENRKWKRI